MDRTDELDLEGLIHLVQQGAEAETIVRHARYPEIRPWSPRGDIFKPASALRPETDLITLLTAATAHPEADEIYRAVAHVVMAFGGSEVVEFLTSEWDDLSEDQKIMASMTLSWLGGPEAVGKLAYIWLTPLFTTPRQSKMAGDCLTNLASMGFPEAQEGGLPYPSDQVVGSWQSRRAELKGNYPWDIIEMIQCKIESLGPTTNVLTEGTYEQFGLLLSRDTLLSVCERDLGLSP